MDGPRRTPVQPLCKLQPHGHDCITRIKIAAVVVLLRVPVRVADSCMYQTFGMHARQSCEAKDLDAAWMSAVDYIICDYIVFPPTHVRSAKPQERSHIRESSRFRENNNISARSRSSGSSGLSGSSGRLADEWMMSGLGRRVSGYPSQPSRHHAVVSVRTVTTLHTQDVAHLQVAATCSRKDRKSTRLNSSHSGESRMPSSA